MAIARKTGLDWFRFLSTDTVRSISFRRPFVNKENGPLGGQAGRVDESGKLLCQFVLTDKTLCDPISFW